MVFTSVGIDDLPDTMPMEEIALKADAMMKEQSSFSFVEMLERSHRLLIFYDGGIRQQAYDNRYFRWKKSSTESRTTAFHEIIRLIVFTVTVKSKTLIHETPSKELRYRIFAAIDEICLFLEQYRCFTLAAIGLGEKDHHVQHPTDMGERILEEIGDAMCDLHELILTIIPVLEDEILSVMNMFRRSDSITTLLNSVYMEKMYETGEITAPLLSPNKELCKPWIELWQKADRAASLELLLLTTQENRCCRCRTVSFTVFSMFIIQWRCPHILCVYCKLVTQCDLCPECLVDSKYWMTSDNFQTLKAMMKKRRAETRKEDSKRLKTAA